MESLLLIALAIFLGFASVITFSHRDEVASGLYNWYNNKRDPEWKPDWLPWQFRPTHRQTYLVCYILVAGGAGMSLYALLAALGAVAAA